MQPDGSLQQPEIGESPLLSKQEALRALRAAVRAWGEGAGRWPTTSVRERIARTRDFVGAMRDRRQEVAILEMWEIGKSYADCLKEFDRTVAYIEETLAELERLQKATAAAEIAGGIAACIRRAPFGPVLCMGPYNYPLNENFTTLIPALLMGNPVVVKLPRYGMLCNLPLLEAFATCFPPGVVNVIVGDGPTVVQPIMESGHVSVLAFIGSSRAANAIERYHPRPNRLRRIFGLEAKNPAVVLKDADLPVAVRECTAGALTFNGQRCTAIKQVWVEKAFADSFLAAFAKEVSCLPAGMPWVDGVRLTPLPEAHKVEYLTGLVEDAVRKGARVVNPGGGEHIGTFFSPAVLYPVTPDMRVFQEEQFGPVVPVSPIHDTQEMLDAFEASNYGQQVSVFGRDPARLGRLIDPLTNQVARINLNTQCQRGPDVFPFTGRKDSAIGTLSIYDALRSFSIRAMVATQEKDVGLLADLGKGHSRFLA
jgi:glyceraldehyde-3-phosphate dehydrogenase (NADP+)